MWNMQEDVRDHKQCSKIERGIANYVTSVESDLLSSETERERVVRTKRS